MMDTSDKILISIVIPTYNRASILNNTLKCVFDQTYRNFEIIVVDDGSKDDTKKIVDSFNDSRIKYICHESNQGATVARNTGIKAANGKWIAFLDSDDIWLPTKLDEQVRIINELKPNVGVIHCGLQYVDFKTGKNLNTRISRGNVNELVKNNLGIIPQTSTMLIRKDALLNVGLFDEKLPAHQESELGLRLSQKYEFKLIDKVLVNVMRNHEQITSNPSLRVKAKEIILSKHDKLLSNSQKFNFYNIIIGDSIVKGDFTKAKKYFPIALGAKFKIKTFVTYLLIYISPKLLFHFYKKKYKSLGINN